MSDHSAASETSLHAFAAFGDLPPPAQPSSPTPTPVSPPHQPGRAFKTQNPLNIWPPLSKRMYLLCFFWPPKGGSCAAFPRRMRLGRQLEILHSSQRRRKKRKKEQSVLISSTVTAELIIMSIVCYPPSALCRTSPV